MDAKINTEFDTVEEAKQAADKSRPMQAYRVVFKKPNGKFAFIADISSSALFRDENEGGWVRLEACYRGRGWRKVVAGQR